MHFLTYTIPAIMVAFLAPKFGFIETIRAVWVALAGGKLPAGWTRHALVLTWPAAAFAADVALFANAPVAVVSLDACR